MIRSARLLLALSLVTMLAACGHARVVRIDGESPRATHSRPIPRPAAPPRPAAEAVSGDGYHVVQSGETLYGISFRYGLRYQDVAAWNHLDDASVIEVGQRLRLRPPSVVTAALPPSPVARTPTPVVTPAATAAATPAPVPTVAATPPPRQLTPVVLASAPSWRWPTSGQVIARFVAGDPTQQGIDIAGSAGQPVIAAADGVVVYSGAGLVGYGELIIIKHNEQWLSAYAHNRKRLVAEGARIKAGDVIAELGRSGATRDMLHFEIRLNGKPVDPLLYLPKP